MHVFSWLSASSLACLGASANVPLYAVHECLLGLLMCLRRVEPHTEQPVLMCACVTCVHTQA